MKLTRCTAHRPNADVWQPACVRCGTRLLDRDVSPEQLRTTIETLVGQEVQFTGRIRGTWAEMAEDDGLTCFVYWARPSSNAVGFEAVELDNPEPTGEELSRAFLVEMMSAPQVSASPGESAEGFPVSETPEIGTAWVRPRRSRWERFKTWSRANAEREFITIAAPMTCIWLVALGWVLGWDGMSALAGLLVGWLF